MIAVAARRSPVAGALSLGIVAAMLWHFHARFWWPVDEGVYAYVAQRILAGDVLHRDLIDLHGGYGNLINALAFLLFGEDLRSLRYPLVAATFAQCVMVFALLAGRGPLTAAGGTVAVGALSFIQFLNPSANWYALFLFFLTALLLDRAPPRATRTLVLAGVLIGLCFLVRQLSGVFLALGTLSWLLLRLSGDAEGNRVVGWGAAAVMAFGLAGYLASKDSLIALSLFGVWPFGIVYVVARRARLSLAEGARIAALITLGAVLAALPLAVHYAVQGALVAWLRDMVVTALLINGQDFIGQASYGSLLLAALGRVFAFADVVTVLNGLFWIVLLGVCPVTGALAVADLVRRRQHAVDSPLPILAAFWGMVGVHYQIPIYLFFALPASLAALLWLRPGRPLALAVLGLAAWAIAFHAGQPLSRGLLGAVEGRRVALEAGEGLPRASLRIEAADRQIYAALLARIAAGARENEPLMTLPMDPEINFMTGQRAPVPYYGTPLGLGSESDVADTLARLRAAAPLFVVHRREDKYFTPLSAILLDEIRALAPPPEPFGPFDLYRLPPAPVRAAPLG